MEEQLRALAGPRRRQILELVRDRELSAGQIAAHFEVTRPAISQHLTVLKAAGLVAERRDGTRRLYRANPAGLAGLKQFIDRFWATGLARLKTEAEAEAARPGPAAPRSRAQRMTITGGRIEQEIHIQAPPEVVFGFFTDPALHDRWLGQRATLDPRRGGIYRVVMTDSATVAGEYLNVEPPHRVVFTWGFENNPGIPPGSSTVSITLTADHNGTRVRLVHTGLPHPAIAPHHQGWAGYLAQLAEVAASP